MKRLTATMLTLALTATMVSCGKTPEETTEETTKETTTEATEESSEETEETEDTEETSEEITVETETAAGFDPSEPWCQAYLDAIPEYFADESYLSMLTYTLIYVDDDDIPEVFIEGDCEAAGEVVLTYHDGEVNGMYLPRLGTQYIPGTGLLYTNTGHMDYYPVVITSLTDGEFTTVAEGAYYMSEETYAQLADDPEAELVYTYEWDGQEMSEDEFNDHVNEYYDMEQSVYPGSFYTYDEFTTLLTTGAWESADHRYELIVSDCTWDEAKQDCIDRGGYLAVISCTPEAQVIADLIREEGLEDCYFYTGYMCSCYINGDFYPAGFYYPDLTSPNPDGLWFNYDYSYYNCPDFDWNNVPFSEDDHEVGILIYYPDYNFFYIYDGPNDLNADSSNSGLIAYVCEYDS